MARCEMCGNDYDKAFQITMGGQTRTFDSFECAISMMAPKCVHCGCRILGHGVESDAGIFCCAHCAHQAGVRGLQDRFTERTEQGSHMEDRQAVGAGDSR